MLRQVFVPMALLAAAPACAQMSASVGVVSDYRYRGASLSDGRPALQWHLGYDFAGGGYAGVLLSSARVDEPADNEVQAVPYVGKVWALSDGWHWEAGAQYTAFSRSGEYDYAELYAGIGTQREGVHLHYANRYFGRGPVWYVEYDGRRALSERWQILGHAGVLRTQDDHSRYDWSIGTEYARSDYALQVLWNAAFGDVEPNENYRSTGYGAKRGLVLRLARSW